MFSRNKNIQVLPSQKKMKKIDIVMSPDYMPSEEDCLKNRSKTGGKHILYMFFDLLFIMYHLF